MLMAICVSSVIMSYKCFHLHFSNFGIELAYDICEDEPTLDYIESEMAREGVTQEVNYLH